MTCGVLLFPVLVVSGVLEYRMDQVHGVFGISSFLEQHQPSRAPSAVAEVKQALARVGHILRHQVRRLGNGQKILGIPGLRASECADFAVRPGLPGQPRHRVVAVLPLTPSQVPVADVLALR